MGYNMGRPSMDSHVTMATYGLILLYCYCCFSIRPGDAKGDFYFGTTPRAGSGSDDLVIPAERADCQEVNDVDCPDNEVDPDALISARVTYRPTPPSTTFPSPTPSDLVELEAPCEADDEDCITGSGSGHELGGGGDSSSSSTVGSDPTPEDKDPIIIDVGAETTAADSTSPEVIIFVNQNMTEKPLRPGVSRRPGQIATTPPSRGGSGGGGGSGPNTPRPRNVHRGGTALGMNIGLIVGIAVGVVLLLLVIAFAFYKYKSRDEGSYKIDESKNYSYETCNTKPPPQVNGAGYAKTSSNCSKSKKKDVKEWYV